MGTYRKRRAAASGPSPIGWTRRVGRAMARTMRKRTVLGILLGLGAASAAHAGTFGGFGGREDAFLVGRDKICAPVAVNAGVARGAPVCRTAGADEVARLSVKTPTPERGPQATFVAVAKGRSLVVSRKDGGQAVVSWESPDPIGRVVEVYASSYQRLVAVEFLTRRGGREVEDVVVFDLRKTASPSPSPTPSPSPSPSPTPTPSPSPSPSPPPPPIDPALTKAVSAARKTSGAKAAAAWKKVLDLDAAHSEARYAIAVGHAKGKRAAEAIATLDALASSTRADAVEFRVAARFDPAFAAMRADPKFRAAVGLDRPATTFYERMMGFGGTWEQPGTSCDSPEVHLALARDRTFALRVRSRCEGMDSQAKFRGRWLIREPSLVLVLPNQGRADEEVVCGVESRGDEDAVTCRLDEDLDFTVRPVRR